MQANTKNKKIVDHVDQHEAWFSTFINDVNKSILEDKKDLASGDASKATRDIYKSLIDGDHIQAMSLMRNQASESLIKEIVISYIEKLIEKQIHPLKLAVDISNNKILVWAELKNGDEATEMSLVRVESIINGTFYESTKIYLDSTIVEENELIPVPPHYRAISFNQ